MNRTPETNSPHKDTNARLWLRATRNADGCLVWEGSVNSKGYGLTTRARMPGQRGRTAKVYAHRFAWEEANGPIPDGLQVDHLCHERRCINPAHLRLATPGQNQENRSGAQRTSRTGHRGVYPLPNGRYAVQVRHKHLGNFADLSEAVRAATEHRRRTMPYSIEARGHQPHRGPCNAEIETDNNRQPAPKPCPCTRQRVRNLPHPETTKQEGQP